MSTTEEELESLPVGHPHAGYLPPEPGTNHNAGTLPDAEQEIADANQQAYEDQAKAVAEHEDAVVKAEREDAEVAPSAPAKTSTSTKSSSSSSSGS